MMLEYELRKAFSLRFKMALEQKGMTRAELSRATGIAETTLYGYYHGAYEPKQNNIYLIARALGVTEAFLLGFDLIKDEDENELLDKYYRLSDQNKKMVNMYIDTLLAMQEKQEDSDVL